MMAAATKPTAPAKTTKTAKKTTGRKTTGRSSVKLTRTCQDNDAFTSAAVVAALEAAWSAIRTRHDEVPEVVIIVGSGTATKNPLWGYFADRKWQHGESRLPEILIAGEGLNRPVNEVLATLLHEAAHALANVRGIKETSRQGRWHNKKFARLADELGLDSARDERLGWSLTKLRDDTATTYADTLTTLKAALTAYRHPELRETKARTSSNNPNVCECSCPRKIRVALAVLDEGPILCTVCEDTFTPIADEGESS